MNNLQMQIFQDFVLTKNQTGNNIIRAFTHKKKILHGKHTFFKIII